MKNKILIVVYVPMLEKEYDIYVPIVKKIGSIKNLIISIVSEDSNGSFTIDNYKNLYNKETGNLLDDNSFVKNSGLENGSKVILY